MVWLTLYLGYHSQRHISASTSWNCFIKMLCWKLTYSRIPLSILLTLCEMLRCFEILWKWAKDKLQHSTSECFCVFAFSIRNNINNIILCFLYLVDLYRSSASLSKSFTYHLQIRKNKAEATYQYFLRARTVTSLKLWVQFMNPWSTKPVIKLFNHYFWKE